MRVAYVGSFGPRSHPAEGTAVVLTDGTQTFLRFDDDFATDNGPDLNVYLHTAGPDASVDDLVGDFIDLGDLKGNIGAQNFVIPGDVDLDRYSTVSVWCVRFRVVFGTAGADELDSRLGRVGGGLALRLLLALGLGACRPDADVRITPTGKATACSPAARRMLVAGGCLSPQQRAHASARLLRSGCGNCGGGGQGRAGASCCARRRPGGLSRWRADHPGR